MKMFIVQSLLPVLYAAAIFTCYYPASAQQSSGKAAPAERILSMGFSDGKAFEFEKELTENIGGRPVGSAALMRAEHWAKGKFEQMGLTVTIQEVGRLPVEFVRGPAEGSATIGDEIIDLHFVTPAFTAGTDGDKSAQRFGGIGPHG